MILWHDLNFWTAVGQIGLGVIAGMVVGAIIRRARRMALPPVIPSIDRMCPSCGAPTLRRVHAGSPRRLLGVLTGRWSHVCASCNWPETARKRSFFKKPAQTESDTRTTLAPRIVAPPPPVLRTTKDDAMEVKDSVFRYLALLNAGDSAARANCYLSEFTSFDADGRPLKSNGIDWRAAASAPNQVFDLRCRDLRVYIHKDTAIATAYLVGTIKATSGLIRRVSGRSSWVHLRQGGEWKIAHTHLSPLTPEN